MKKLSLFMFTLMFTVYFTCVLYEAKLSFFDWSESVRHTASILTGILVGITLIGYLKYLEVKEEK